MDPNTALREMRDALSRWWEAADGTTHDDEHAAGAALADAAEALDSWLSRGGFLPDAWGRCEGIGTSRG